VGGQTQLTVRLRNSLQAETTADGPMGTTALSNSHRLSKRLPLTA
jgi:hypothetical protein